MKIYKRITAGSVAASLCLASALLTGCATPNAGNVTSATDNASAVQAATITTRTVSFPKIYFGDISEEEAKAKLTEAGCTDIVANEGGGYTATMPISKYNELVDAMHASVGETLNAIPGSEDYPSISSIEFEEQFSSVTMHASKSSLGFTEMFVSWVAAFPACMYQQIAGQPVSCTVTVLDPNGIEIQGATYPDAWSQDTRDSVTVN